MLLKSWHVPVPCIALQSQGCVLPTPFMKRLFPASSFSIGIEGVVLLVGQVDLADGDVVIVGQEEIPVHAFDVAEVEVANERTVLLPVVDDAIGCG